MGAKRPKRVVVYLINLKKDFINVNSGYHRKISAGLIFIQIMSKHFLHDT